MSSSCFANSVITLFVKDKDNYEYEVVIDREVDKGIKISTQNAALFKMIVKEANDERMGTNLPQITDDMDVICKFRNGEGKNYIQRQKSGSSTYSSASPSLQTLVKESEELRKKVKSDGANPGTIRCLLFVDIQKKPVYFKFGNVKRFYRIGEDISNKDFFAIIKSLFVFDEMERKNTLRVRCQNFLMNEFSSRKFKDFVKWYSTKHLCKDYCRQSSCVNGYGVVSELGWCRVHDEKNFERVPVFQIVLDTISGYY